MRGPWQPTIPIETALAAMRGIDQPIDSHTVDPHAVDPASLDVYIPQVHRIERGARQADVAKQRVLQIHILEARTRQPHIVEARARQVRIVDVQPAARAMNGFGGPTM